MNDRPLGVLALSAFAMLVAALSVVGQSQQPPPAKSASLHTACSYDNQEVIDCIYKKTNGDLSVREQVLQQLQFDSYGLAAVRSEANGWMYWMYVSRTGKVVISGVLTTNNGAADTFHDGLIRVVRNGKFGFSNRKGQLVIPAVYDEAMNFENGKARVCKGCTNNCKDCGYRAFSGQWFEIDTKGAVVLVLPSFTE